MRFNILQIDSDLNLDQCNIHQCHRIPKCDNLLYSRGLVVWFKVKQAAFGCSQICCGVLHVLISFYLNGSCGAGLESKLIAVGNNPTCFLYICNALNV